MALCEFFLVGVATRERIDGYGLSSSLWWSFFHTLALALARESGRVDGYTYEAEQLIISLTENKPTCTVP